MKLRLPTNDVDGVKKLICRKWFVKLILALIRSERRIMVFMDKYKLHFSWKHFIVDH